MSLLMALRTLLATAAVTAAFLTVVYLAYGCMQLGPVAPVRRWGAETWWRLTQFGPPNGG